MRELGFCTSQLRQCHFILGVAQQDLPKLLLRELRFIRFEVDCPETIPHRNVIGSQRQCQLKSQRGVVTSAEVPIDEPQMLQLISMARANRDRLF